MKVVDIATQIYLELSSPTDLSIPVIGTWLRNNLGMLNSATNKSYSIDATTLEIQCVDPNNSALYEEISQDEVTILQLLYSLHYYDMQIRKNMLSYDTQTAINISSDGHSVRLVSPTEIGKNLYMFRKSLSEELEGWITKYRIARCVPRDIHSDDNTNVTSGIYSYNEYGRY